MPDVAHDTDDFGRPGVGPIADDALADGILVRAVLVDERLIHQRDARAVHAVLPLERPAPQNRDAHGRKVTAAHRRYIGFHALRVGGNGPSNNVERPVVGKPCKREELNCADRADFR